MNNAEFKRRIREQKAIADAKKSEGFTHGVRYFNGEDKYFKHKPTNEETKNAILIFNLI